MNKKTILSDRDRERIIELTGESPMTLSRALDQWENERGALSELHDSIQALEIYISKIKGRNLSYRKIIKRVVDEGDLFFSQKTRDMIVEFWKEIAEVEKIVKQSETVTKGK